MTSPKELLYSFIYSWEREITLQFTQNICFYSFDEEGNVVEGFKNENSFMFEMEPENFTITAKNKKAESYSNVGEHFRRFYEFVHESDNIKIQKTTYHVEGLKCKVKKTKIVYTKIKCEEPTLFESFFLF